MLIDSFLVPPEVEAAYATIIDSILAASDLNTISEKRIRKGLQQAVEYDITPQKVGKVISKLKYRAWLTSMAGGHQGAHYGSLRQV